MVCKGWPTEIGNTHNAPDLNLYTLGNQISGQNSTHYATQSQFAGSGGEVYRNTMQDLWSFVCALSWFTVSWGQLFSEC